VFRQLLKSKLHRATITRSDLDYEGSIAIGECLLEKAAIRPMKQCTCGISRMEQGSKPFARSAEHGSHEICLNRAAVRPAIVGDNYHRQFSLGRRKSGTGMSAEGRLPRQPEPGYGKTLTLPICRLKPIHIASPIRTSRTMRTRS
jgi:aspartate 1-decarboxylase